MRAGDLIGFMGRTGYSDQENVNNIETVHLHFGMELIFDESQKECNSEIWIDVYQIVRLLSAHTSTLEKTADGWQRRYPGTWIRRTWNGFCLLPRHRKRPCSIGNRGRKGYDGVPVDSVGVEVVLPEPGMVSVLPQPEQVWVVPLGSVTH